MISVAVRTLRFGSLLPASVQGEALSISDQLEVCVIRFEVSGFQGIQRSGHWRGL